MTEGLFSALALAAVSVGALHSLAPDHWVPFAAVARARGWSGRRTALVTLACGFGHVTASVTLGGLGLVLGLELLRSFGERMEAVAGILLVAFGLGYGLWGFRRAVRGRLPAEDPRGGSHGHPHAGGDPARTTARALFVLFSLDPCVAVLPLLFAAAPLGAGRTATVVALYELATLATMILLVLPARTGARAIRAPWLDRYGDAVAGAVISSVGVAVALLGI